MKILITILLIVALVIGVLSLQMFFKNKKTPANLGVTDGKLAPMPSSPNAVSSQTDIPEKKVDPFPFKGSLEETKSAILKILKQYGDIEVVSDSGPYIHAISISKRMGYRDDLEFYFDEAAQRVDFRSASRVGYGDMGLNRDRYNRLMELYKNE